MYETLMDFWMQPMKCETYFGLMNGSLAMFLRSVMNHTNTITFILKKSYEKFKILMSHLNRMIDLTDKMTEA